MKQSRVFNRLFSLLFVGGMTAGYEAHATGIPVYCFNCQEASHNAAHAILDGIRGQTEALIRAMDYSMRVQAAVEDEREVARQKTKNDRELEPSLGAKPRAACSQMGAAALRGAAASSSAKIKAAVAKSIRAHNNRGGQLAAGESGHDYDMKKIFEKMDADGEEFEAGKVVLDREPIEPADYHVEVEKVAMLTNPYPVDLPPEEEQERIKQKGTPEEKKKLAESIVLHERLSVPQKILTDQREADLKKLESDKVATMLADVLPYLDAEQQASLSGNLSENQLDELLATYRVKSPQWITTAATADATAATRDIMLINAEMLNQLWKLNRNLEKLNAITALNQTRELSRDGLISR